MGPRRAPQAALEYVVSVPTGFHSASAHSWARLRELTSEDGIIDGLGNDGEKLASLNLDQLRALKAKVPGLVIEPNIKYRTCGAPQGGACDWGHVFAEVSDGTAGGGAGVRIGIIDSGIRQDHPDLAPCGGLNCIWGEEESRWWADGDGHGTHCAGIIAATGKGGGIRGYAPQAEIFSYRAFNQHEGTTFDLLKAIQTATGNRCDIICMGFSHPAPQIAVRAAMERARDNGVLCVAAVGNDRGPVGYPAGFWGVVGVSAFGRFGDHSQYESESRSTDGALYFASFSNFGEHVEFCAPGVAIRSTIPGGYGLSDGTSMACAHVVGMAALALASHPEILEANRDADRADCLLGLLRARAQFLGFGRDYEGSGCLKVPHIVGTV